MLRESSYVVKKHRFHSLVRGIKDLHLSIHDPDKQLPSCCEHPLRELKPERWSEGDASPRAPGSTDLAYAYTNSKNNMRPALYYD